jgi:hypothetical protein
MVHRSDNNQKEIVDALRKVGASVLVLSNAKNVEVGTPDLLVGHTFRGGEENLLMEIKSDGKPLRETQENFKRKWKGQYTVIESPEEALRYIGAIK